MCEVQKATSMSESVKVPGKAKQTESAPTEWAWVDRAIWTERMLAALGNGVKGNKWFITDDGRMFTSQNWDCSPWLQPTERANPDEETTNWRAVCGKTARTVRREGRTVSFPTPIAELPGADACPLRRTE